MSYSEYYDLFKKAQLLKKGYLMIIADVQKSKTDKNYIPYRNKFISKMDKTAKEMNAVNLNNIDGLNTTFEKILINGDAVGFVVYSYNKEKTFKEFLEKNTLKNLPLSFHFNCGFFETFKYEEGNKKYWIGYAFQQLEKNSKK